MADLDGCRICDNQVEEGFKAARNSTAFGKPFLPQACDVFCFDCIDGTFCTTCDWRNHLGSPFGWMHVRMPVKQYKSGMKEVAGKDPEEKSLHRQMIYSNRHAEHTCTEIPKGEIPDFTKESIVELLKRVYGIYITVTKRQWPLEEMLNGDNRFSTGSSTSTASTRSGRKQPAFVNPDRFSRNMRLEPVLLGEDLLKHLPQLERELVDACVEHEFYSRQSLHNVVVTMQNDPDVKLLYQALEAQGEYLLAQIAAGTAVESYDEGAVACNMKYYNKMVSRSKKNRLRCQCHGGMGGGGYGGSDSGGNDKSCTIQ